MLAPSAGASRGRRRRRADRSPGPRCRPPSRAGSGRPCPTPARRLTWATWPSTHTMPSRSIQPATAWAIWRTGAGACGDVSSAMRRAARGGRRPTVIHGVTAPRLGHVTSTDLGIPRIADSSVLLAAPRGYCAGVDRAVVTVEKALDLYGAPVYVRKQIVHNKHVVSDLESRGAIFVEELDEVPEGETVVFSAHGVSPAVHTQAAERGLKTIDATCPLVTKVHHEAQAFRRVRLRHPADRPRGPRGGRGHRGRGAGAHPAGAGSRRCRLDRGPRPVQGRLALADHALGRRDPRDGGRDPASASPSCSTRRATTSATPPRTASSPSRRSPRAPTW